MNVLGWLRTPPHLLNIFVANRIVQIHDLAPGCHWHYMPGNLNPADCGSRGLLISELISHNL